MIEHGIQLDHLREARLGFDEAVYAAGKTVAQLDALIGNAIEMRSRRLFTRLPQEKLDALKAMERALIQREKAGQVRR